MHIKVTVIASNLRQDVEEAGGFIEWVYDTGNFDAAFPNHRLRARDHYVKIRNNDTRKSVVLDVNEFDNVAIF